jgi:low temperature requirement protein LtrA
MPFAWLMPVTQVGRSLFMLWALKNHDAGNFLNFIRIVLWQASRRCSGSPEPWLEGQPG